MSPGSVASAHGNVFDEPVCGMTWGWVGTRGTWNTTEAKESMAAMRELSVNWVALAYAAEQDTATSTEVRWHDGPAVEEDEIVVAIREAKSLGLKVCLKPVVNCTDGTWRAHIGFLWPDVPGEPTWDEWFASYTKFIVAAARIAQAEACDMLAIGCEMVRADQHESHWRALISEVRAVYQGLVTYNCDKYQEDRLTWWDAVDVISSSGYYRVDDWEAQLDRIEQVVAAHGKPFVFLEAGCPSREGSAMRPNDWSHPGAPSGTEQQRFYQAMFEACAARPWVRGFVLWDWPAQLYPLSDAARNDDYCPYGKPAAHTIRDRYSNWLTETTA